MYLDSSYLDVDMHPNYVKVIIKDKVFQIVLPEEIKPDISTAQRSQTTGHLVLTMFKANDELKIRQMLVKHTLTKQKDNSLSLYNSSNFGRREYLEIGRSDDMDFTNIVDRDKKKKICKNSKNSEISDFADNPEVPPLE